jgi:hypothetical protein
VDKRNKGITFLVKRFQQGGMMKLGKLAQDGFVKALNELNAKELPAALAYRISKVSSIAAQEQQEYFKLRAAVIQKFIKKNEDGSNKTALNASGEEILDFGEDKETVSAELVSLEEQEVELPMIKIKLADLERANFSLSAATLNVLADVIEVQE